MKNTFESSFFATNRSRLREVFGGSAPIVVAGNGLLQRSADTPFAFRQDSSFWYLTGVDEPDMVLVIDTYKTYLILPERDKRLLTFDGDIDRDELQELSGVDEVLEYKEGWQRFGRRLRRAKHVATLEPPKSYIAALQLYTNPARRKLVRKIKTYSESVQFLDLRLHLAGLRSVKQEPELAAIQHAIDHTQNIFEIITARLGEYQYEYQIAADVQHYLLQNQLSEAYAPIIGGGKNAVTLHYVKNDAQLKPRECVLLDIGASYGYYAADITRTLCLRPTRRQKLVYEAVVAVQEYALGKLRPGVLIREYEADVEHFMGEKLRELGLIRTITHENVREYYPHATSHFLGLDVHDVGDYEKPLAPGMVLTVEPGIYIPDERIGIRLEDNIVITGTGNHIMSSNLPKLLNITTI